MLNNRAVIDLSFIMHKRPTVAVGRNGTQLRGLFETVTCLGMTHHAASGRLAHANTP